MVKPFCRVRASSPNTRLTPNTSLIRARGIVRVRNGSRRLIPVIRSLFKTSLGMVGAGFR